MGAHQAGVDHGPPPVLALAGGDLGHQGADVGPHRLGRGGQVGGERPADARTGEVENLVDEPVGTAEELPGGDRPLEVEVGVVLPGEADAAEELYAVLRRL